jgi:alpha-N-arabinofuranosidase
MQNVAWGIPELNTFGTDEFLHFCDLVDAKPQIALNLGSGSPEEAAGWVKYVNEDPAWKGRGTGQLWELGNELWGNWNTGWPTLVQLAPRTKAFADAVHGADPSAKLIATGQDPDAYEKWNAAQLVNPAGTTDYLSTHFVVTTDQTKWRGATDEFRAMASFALPVQLGRQIETMTQQIDATDKRGKEKIAFTEWLWVKGRERQDESPVFTNFAGALTTAGNYNMMLRESDIVPVSDMTGVIEFAGIWKKKGQVYGTPASYVFKMYATAPADHLLSAKVDGGEYTVHNGVTRLPEIAHVPYLDVTATADKAGKTITIFAVNRSVGQEIPATLNVPGARRGQKAEVMEMTSNDLWDANSELRPTALIPQAKTVMAGDSFAYTFPAASVTRITIEVGR